MDAPLVVAHVDTESGFSGGQVQVFLLMEGLARAGHRNVLFCPPDSAAARRAEELGIAVRPVPMRNDLHLTAVGRLSRGFLESDVHLVHLHTGRANWLGGWAALRAKLPAITTRRMDKQVRDTLATRLIYGRLVRRAVAISPTVEGLLWEGGVPRTMTSTIWSAVEPASLTPDRSREAVRHDLGLEPEAHDVVVLVMARLHRRKGLDVLLHALCRCGAGGRGLKLLVAGDGPEREALERLAAELGLVDVVTFLGVREDKARLLAACDVFCMPSRREGLGVAALEAMAAGRPVLGSRVGGLADAVVHGRTGWLVPPEDADALSEALVRLADDAEWRRSLGAAGPGRIDEGFRADQMVAAYEALYREVLAEAAAG